MILVHRRTHCNRPGMTLEQQGAIHTSSHGREQHIVEVEVECSCNLGFMKHVIHNQTVP